MQFPSVMRRRWSTPYQQSLYWVESGARMVDAILTNTLLPEISRHVLMEKWRAGDNEDPYRCGER